MTDSEPLDLLLASIAEDLDVSDSAYEQARARYEAVGDWLCAVGSPLAQHSPKIYAQGSFALGTVVKPLRNDEYDVDAVVELSGPQAIWTPSALKQSVGARLRQNGNYQRMLQEEGRRCWTLRYASEPTAPGFHLDLLPSVPSALRRDSADTSIAITNRETSGAVDWRESDPRSYAAWFKKRMEVRQRRALTEKRAEVEALPLIGPRTPLQYVVQILKRQRDVMFQQQPDIAPISVIISTLAGYAYDGEARLADAFLRVVERLPTAVGHAGNGIAIENPVNPSENFADRWEGDPQKREAFFRWLEAVVEFGQDLRSTAPDELSDKLRAVLGESTTRTVLAKYAARSAKTAAARTISISPPTPPPQPQGLFSRAKDFLVSLPKVLAEATHRHPPSWPFVPTVPVTLSAIATIGESDRRSVASGCTLPVGTELTFRAATNAGFAAEYYWQVVNTGAEAFRANKPRGNFERGHETHVENVLYRGTHSIECFVIQNGMCVARSGPFVVNVR